MADDSTPVDPGSADSSGSDTSAEPLSFLDIGAQLVSGGFPHGSFDALADALANAGVKEGVSKLQFFKKNLPKIAAYLGKFLEDGEELLLPIAAAFAAPSVAEMLGGELDVSAFANKASSDGRNAAAAALVDTFIASLTGGDDGPIEAGDAGAKRVASAGLRAALSGWLLTAIPEMVSDLIPFEIGHFQSLTKLPDEIIHALGIGRLVRAALRPYINAVATTPLTWKTNAQYRPTKLPINVAVKQFLRGAWDHDQLLESAARDGYRDEDVDALVNDGKKFPPLGELEFLVWLGLLDADSATQTLSDAGFDAQTASKIVHTDALKRLDVIGRSVAEAGVTAFVDGHIDVATLDELLDATLGSSQAKPALHDAALAKRALRVVPLSPTEAETCVLNGIVPIADYTDALVRAGRAPEAIDALELLLRKRLDDKLTIEQHKQELASARAAAAQAKADAAALHAATVKDAAQRKALGSLNTLERAVVHGLIPIDRLEQLLTLEFPAETVAIYVADVQQRRAAYLAQQQKAADAAKKAAGKGLPTGALRAAFLDQVLSADEVQTMLAGGGLGQSDISVLLATWQHALDAKTAAAKLRADAAARSKTHRLSLGEAETLAVSGHWTLDAFNAYLATLGYSDADAAHLDLIVNDRIAKQHAARAVKAAASATNPIKGLSLAQAARAVVLGEQTMTDFQAWLVKEGYAADAIGVLVAETQTAADAADAARARRSTAATAVDGRPVPLAEVTRAAQLGLLTPGEYQAALVARGFAPEAIALDLQLLSYEIAHAKHPAPAAGSAAAALAASGTSPLVFANKRHVAIDGELAGRGLSLAESETAVKEGRMTYAAFQSWLEANGYAPADAELLRALLGIKLGAPGS